jgi:hypothetical protein
MPVTKIKLLKNAIMLHMAFYLMEHIPIISKESAELAVKCLRAPKMLPFEPALVSTLVTRQIKQTMQSLLDDLTAEVLEGLEHELRPRKTKSSWAISFCVISILFMSVE